MGLQALNRLANTQALRVKPWRSASRRHTRRQSGLILTSNLSVFIRYSLWVLVSLIEGPVEAPAPRVKLAILNDLNASAVEIAN